MPTCSLTPGWSRDDLARGHAADRHLALPGPEVLHRQARDVAADVFERLRVRALDVGRRLRVDREGTSCTVDARLVAVTMISPWSSLARRAGCGLAACAARSAGLCGPGVATAKTEVPMSKVAEMRMVSPFGLFVLHGRHMPEQPLQEELRPPSHFPASHLLQECYRLRP